MSSSDPSPSSADAVDAILAADPMMAAIDSTPDGFGLGARAAAEIGAAFADEPVDHVVVAGMGGSAFPADLLDLITRPLGRPVFVSRDYVVRAPITAQSLVIASSFSGNTEETLAAFADAGRRGARRIAITHGGKLAAMAKADGVPVVRLPKPFPTFQPRAATSMFVGALGRLLTDMKLVDGVGAALDAVAARLRSLDVHPRARELGKALRGTIPLFLVSPPLLPVARILRIKVNENGKMPAFADEISEFDHNLLVGFTRGFGRLVVVLLHDPTAAERMRLRVATTGATLREAGVPVHDVHLIDAPPIEQAFAVLNLFDVVSCRLAIQDGIDPNPVELIEGFKARLGPFPSPAG